jgi:hypothetical protein
VTVCSCGCGQIPKPPRQTWFSKACVDRWREKNDVTYIRQQLKKRDKGVCALCGCDADAEYRRWCQARQTVERLVSWLYNAQRLDRDWDERKQRWVFRPQVEEFNWRKVATRKRELQKKFTPPGKWTAGRRTGWDADHIVAVIEGGGLCGLENYRTLCHPCHKEITKDLAARRAAARKREKALEVTSFEVTADSQPRINVALEGEISKVGAF